MSPTRPLPISAEFLSADTYVASLIDFATRSQYFQTFCGGVHILDFYTSQPDLYATILPASWREWFQQQDMHEILSTLMQRDLDASSVGHAGLPSSLLEYVKEIRKHSLRRAFSSRGAPAIARHVATGMRPKKVHEVREFAHYVHGLAASLEAGGQDITHLVDFGSGQNYLGRALASPPYHRQIIAIESKASNIAGAREWDLKTRMAGQPRGPSSRQRNLAKIPAAPPTMAADSIQYIQHRILDGSLSRVHDQIQSTRPPQLMVMSLHSCGNLVHHGLRSLVLNEAVVAVAMVGCCYNLMTERLGPPTYKLPTLRPDNARVIREGLAFDPHGFPMSERFATCDRPGGRGIRLNITARMMAVQAPNNWTAEESEAFFTRHYYRALLQRIFLDRGVVGPSAGGPMTAERKDGGPAGTDPVIIGSLRKACYASFTAYVRGAVHKMATTSDLGPWIGARMDGLTDEEIEGYETQYGHRKKEMSILWTLMAFSAIAAEAVIVTDRWSFLREQETVDRCWVEAVFSYDKSPRNLVVVGIKKR
ncbi:MAG: hypothetical protein M1838_000569 [Thelocarpon superellum]|nr:MAG: hypothetical protein M1838_000569 [Thelocarpon superellum]